MKLSEGVEAAIHCAATLAGIDGTATMPASALAAQFGLSASYLLKHLNALAAAGILESVPGPAGGYRLARAANRISLLDIVLAVEGPQPAFRCGEIRRNGPVKLPASAYVKPCGNNAAMLRAEKAYRDELRRVRIADILSELDRLDDGTIAARSCWFRDIHERRSGASA